MKKLTATFIKVSLVSALLAPLAFAADSVVSNSSLAEPIYLSLCGIILLVFGTIKGTQESQN